MSEKRNCTKLNFDAFIDSVKGANIRGYFSDGAIIFTTDSKLLDRLYKQEIKQNHKIRLLNCRNFKIDKNFPIPDWAKHSIFVNQPFVKETFFADEIGGNQTFILADRRSRLSNYVTPIFNRHLEEFDIVLHDGYTDFENNPRVAEFEASITINNNFAGKEKFETMLELRNSPYHLCSIINDANKTDTASQKIF